MAFISLYVILNISFLWNFYSIKPSCEQKAIITTLLCAMHQFAYWVIWLQLTCILFQPISGTEGKKYGMCIKAARKWSSFIVCTSRNITYKICVYYVQLHWLGALWVEHHQWMCAITLNVEICLPPQDLFTCQELVLELQLQKPIWFL